MFNRLRRTRLNPLLRDLVRETRLDLDNFIYPLFVVEGEGIRNEIASMPGVFQLSIDEILKECYAKKSWDKEHFAFWNSKLKRQRRQ